MSKNCSINKTKKTLFGNSVSHSNKKSKKKFLPNLQTYHLYSTILKKYFKVRSAVNSVRTIYFNKGLDLFLIQTKNSKLDLKATKIKKEIKKKLKSNRNRRQD